LTLLSMGGWLLCCLSGCHDRADYPAVVELWAVGREGEIVQQLMPEFERLHPGVRVEVQQIPWTAAHEKLLTAYAGDAMPDVFQLGNTWIPEFVALNAIDRLDDRINRSRQINLDDFFPGILETNRVEGALYGLPWYVDTRLLFYRKDILAAAGHAEPPRSWDVWLQAMTHVKQWLGANHYGVLLPVNEWQMPVILALQLNAELLRDNARYGNFKSAAFRRAFAFYLDLFRRELAPAVGETQIANLYQEFANAYFSMYVTGPWNIGEFSRRLPDSVQNAWSTAPLPGPDERYPGLSLAGGASLAIARTSKRKEAAWRLIEYLAAPERQIEFYRLTGDLPARKAAWQHPALSSNANAQAFWAQLQAVASTPKIPEWERIASKIAHYAEQAVRGELTEDQALTRLDHDVDRILDKRRWLLRRSQR
jgi:multiple sugar transport system substrate-binding protein